MTRKLSHTLAVLSLALFLPSLGFSRTPTEPAPGRNEPTQSEKQCEQWAKGNPKGELACRDALSAGIKYPSPEFDAFMLHAKRADGFNVSALSAKDWKVFSKSMEKVKDQDIANRVEYYVLQEKIGKRHSSDYKEVDDLAGKILIPGVLEKDQYDRFFDFATTEDTALKLKISEVAQIPDPKDRKEYIIWKLQNPQDPKTPMERIALQKGKDGFKGDIGKLQIERQDLQAKLAAAKTDSQRSKFRKALKLNAGNLRDTQLAANSFFAGDKMPKLGDPKKAGSLAFRMKNVTGKAAETNRDVQRVNDDMKRKLMNIKDPPDIQAKKAEEKDSFWSKFAAGMLVLGFAAIFAAVMGAPAAAAIIGALGAGVLGTLLYQRWQANKKEKLASSEGLADLWKADPQAEVQITQPPPEHKQFAKKTEPIKTAPTIAEIVSGQFSPGSKAQPVEPAVEPKVTTQSPTPKTPTKEGYFDNYGEKAKAVGGFLKEKGMGMLNSWFK